MIVHVTLSVVFFALGVVLGWHWAFRWWRRDLVDFGRAEWFFDAHGKRRFRLK